MTYIFIHCSPTHSVASTSFEEPSSIPLDNTKFSIPLASNIQTPPSNTLDIVDVPNEQTVQSTELPSIPPAPSSSPPLPARLPSPQPQQTLHQQQQQAHMAILTEAKEKLKQEKKEKHATKKLIKELAVCKTILGEMEVRFDQIEIFRNKFTNFIDFHSFFLVT